MKIVWKVFFLSCVSLCGACGSPNPEVLPEKLDKPVQVEPSQEEPTITPEPPPPVAIVLDRPQANMDPTYQNFLNHLNEKMRTPIQANSFKQQQIISWIRKYIEISEEEITQENLPHLIGAAIKRMYLHAKIHELDLGANIYDLVLEDIQTPYWANCGDSAEFFLRIAQEFGIQ